MSVAAKTTRSPRTWSVTKRWQVGLVALGLLLLVVGLLVLLDEVAPEKYLGILTWFIAAIIIHDAVISILTFAVAFGLRKFGQRIPFGVLAIVQAAIVVGAVMALIVFPEIYKKSLRAPNITVLTLDYGTNLVFFYAGLIVLTATVIAVYLRMLSRRPLADATATTGAARVPLAERERDSWHEVERIAERNRVRERVRVWALAQERAREQLAERESADRR